MGASAICEGLLKVIADAQAQSASIGAGVIEGLAGNQSVEFLRGWLPGIVGEALKLTRDESGLANGLKAWLVKELDLEQGFARHHRRIACSTVPALTRYARAF
jgi:hypothetical protein